MSLKWSSLFKKTMKESFYKRSNYFAIFNIYETKVTSLLCFQFLNAFKILLFNIKLLPILDFRCVFLIITH